MMHYRKGENVDKELTKEDLPFSDCMTKDQEDFLWMQVKGGSKVSNLISYVKNALDNGKCRTLVWSGSESGIVKTISCAEILKENYPIYQVTRMCYKTIEEHWLPQMDGLEEIVAKRQIPCLHILMSLDEIDDNVNGLQKPKTKTDFWIFGGKNNSNSYSHQRNQQLHPSSDNCNQRQRFNKKTQYKHQHHHNNHQQKQQKEQSQQDS